MGTEGTLDRRRNEISDGAGRCSGVDRTNDGLVEGGDRPQRWHTSTRTYVEYARRGEEQENRRRDMGGCGQAGSREREEAPWKICVSARKGIKSARICTSLPRWLEFGDGMRSRGLADGTMVHTKYVSTST